MRILVLCVLRRFLLFGVMVFVGECIVPVLVGLDVSVGDCRMGSMVGSSFVVVHSILGVIILGMGCSFEGRIGLVVGIM